MPDLKNLPLSLSAPSPNDRTQVQLLDPGAFIQFQELESGTKMGSWYSY